MPRKPQQSGFTLIELLVVIAIIALLAAILFPVFARAREKARQTTCLSNEKQMGLAIFQYKGDYDETWPYDSCGYDTGAAVNGCTTGAYTGTAAGWPAPYNPLLTPTDVPPPAGVNAPVRWTMDIVPYIKSTNIFQEPSSTYQVSGAVAQNQMVGYWTNAAVWFDPKTVTNGLPGPRTEASLADYASNTIIMYDNVNSTNINGATPGNTRSMTYRPSYVVSISGWSDYNTFYTTPLLRQGPHNDIFNALWADGHVKAIKHDALFQQVMPSIAKFNPGTAPFPPS